MNKYLFSAFLFALPISTLAQDCQLHRSIDPYTKEEKISTGFLSLSGGSISIDATKTEINFQVTTTEGDKCFDASTTATIFFDNSKMKYNLRNTGAMNCEGEFHYQVKNSAANTPAMLQKIIKQKVSSVKVIGRDKKEIELKLSTEQQEQFFKLANCIAEEAKTLVK